MSLSRITILNLILFLVPFYGGSQAKTIDSLKKILPSLRDSARIDCLNKLSKTYAEFDIDSIAYYAGVAYKEAVKINYINGIAQAVANKSNVEFHLDSIAAGEQLARESLDWYRKTSNKKGLADAYLRLGYSLFSQSLFTEAIKNLDSSYELYFKESDIEGMHWTLIYSSSVYIESGNYEKAFEKCLGLHQLASGYRSKKIYGSELRSFGELYRGIGDFNTALFYYRQALQLKKPDEWELIRIAELFTLNKQFDSSRYYYSLIDSSDMGQYFQVYTGELYLEQNQFDRALPYLLRSLTYNKQTNDVNQVMRSLMDIARCYAGSHDYLLAYKYAKECLNLTQQKGSKQFLMAGYEILYTFYDKQHKTDSALFYYKKFITTKDSVQSEQFKGKLIGFNYNQRIELLNKEKEIQQAQIKRQSLLKNILIVSIIFVLLLAVIIFRNIVLKRRNEANRRELAENELQIQKLESERTKAELQQQATELEMQALRAQMNPHFIFNCLSSINRFILKNEPDMASDYLTKFSRLIRMVLNNSKNSLILLEDELEMLRLYLDLERLRFKDSFDYSISFHNHFDISSIFIPPLLLQPFAENAIWHGLMHKDGQGHLEIAFKLENSILNCCITDNGVGRKKAGELKSRSAEKQKSLGMQITAGRLALLNEESEQTIFDVEDLVDAEGQAAGTRVTLKIRYKESSDEIS